jgi:hypothetical protein
MGMLWGALGCDGMRWDALWYRSERDPDYAMQRNATQRNAMQRNAMQRNAILIYIPILLLSKNIYYATSLHSRSKLITNY